MSQTYHPSLDDPNAWVPYRYHPSKAAAIVFIIAFGLTTILHSVRIYTNKTWYFIPLVIGGIFETIGYLGRILSTSDIWALGPYIIQSLLLLIAPALFAASIYIILGRIMRLVNGERHSLIRQQRLTKIFVTGDAISFLVQCGGGGIQAAGSLSLLHLGEKIIIVGLFLQLVFFGFFIIVAGIFHCRVSKADSYRTTMRSTTRTQQSITPAVDDLPWKRHMMALYIASTLIMIRSVFRVIEYLQGNNGYVLRHEYFLYIFDAVLMLAVVVLFLVVHPAEITRLYQQRLAGDDSRWSPESRQQLKELQEPGSR